MYLASQSSTQATVRLHVVEQHKGFDVARRFERSEPAFAPTKFEVPDLPQRKDDNVLTVEQAAIGLGLQRYYPIHSVGPTPARLQILLNLLRHNGGTIRTRAMPTNQDDGLIPLGRLNGKGWGRGP